MIVLSTGSCSIYQDYQVPKFIDLQEINRYVFDNIEYKKDFIDFPQSPIQTMELGLGDCEDYVILFSYLVYKNFGLKPYVVIVEVGDQLHSLAYIDDTYYDPTYNTCASELWEGWESKCWIKYDTVMLYSTAFYTKGKL